MNAEVPIHARIEYRPLPFDIEAEQALLGTLIRDPRKYWQVADRNMLAADHFYDALHQRLFAAIATLIPRDETISTVSLNSAMRGDKGLEEVGGIEYLEGLAFSSPAGLNVKATAKIIRDIATRRTLLKLGEDMADACMGEGAEIDPDTLADRFGEQIYDATHREEAGKGPQDIYQVALRAAELADAARRNPDKAKISTGIRCVDTALGGIFPKDLTVLGAAPNLGKSGLVAQIALSAASAGHATMFFSLEMAAEELGMRFIAKEVGVPSNRLTEGRTSEADVTRAFEVAPAMAELPLRIDDTSYLTTAQMRARCQAMRRRQGGLGLVIIDHLRFIRSEDRRADFTEQMQQITRDLKALAKEMEVGVLLVAHLNREFWKRNDHRPILSDLYGASAIEQNADHIWFLHREEYFLERSVPPETDQKAFGQWQEACERARGWAELFGAKRRGGPLGSAKLKFDAPFVRFSDPDDGQPTISAQEMML